MLQIHSLRKEIKRIVQNPENPLEIVLSKAIGDLSEEVGFNNIVLSPELEEELAKINKDAQVRWNRLSKKIDFYCSSCGTKLHNSTCGKFECHICDEIMMVPSKKLHNICGICHEFSNKTCTGNMNHDYESVVIKSRKTKKPISTWVLNTSLDSE
jgi:hypothetical protein